MQIKRRYLALFFASFVVWSLFVSSIHAASLQDGTEQSKPLSKQPTKKRSLFHKEYFSLKSPKGYYHVQIIKKGEKNGVKNTDKANTHLKASDGVARFFIEGDVAKKIKGSNLDGQNILGEILKEHRVLMFVFSPELKNVRVSRSEFQEFKKSFEAVAAESLKKAATEVEEKLRRIKQNGWTRDNGLSKPKYYLIKDGKRVWVEDGWKVIPVKNYKETETSVRMGFLVERKGPESFLGERKYILEVGVLSVNGYLLCFVATTPYKTDEDAVWAQRELRKWMEQVEDANVEYSPFKETPKIIWAFLVAALLFSLYMLYRLIQEEPEVKNNR